MKKKITFTASYIFDWDDDDLEGGEGYNTFEDVEDCDYDNVGRPLNRLRDVGWDITDTKIESID